MKYGKLFAVSVLSTMTLGLGLSTTTAFAADEVDDNPTYGTSVQDNSTVSANILSGGLEVEVGGNGDPNSMNAKDTFLGDLTIGQDIAPVTTKDLLTIRDKTGGKGWDATVKANNYEDTRDSLEVGLAINSKDVKLTNTEASIGSGENQIADHVFDGTFSANWGTNPVIGDWTSNLTWTVSPKL